MSDPAELEQIETICQVNRDRAQQLFEAASGNVERAIHIHFGGENTTGDEQFHSAAAITRPAVVVGVKERRKRANDSSPSSDEKPASKKKASSSSPPSSTGKQSSLDAFLKTSPSISKKNHSKQMDTSSLTTKKRIDVQQETAFVEESASAVPVRGGEEASNSGDERGETRKRARLADDMSSRANGEAVVDPSKDATMSNEDHEMMVCPPTFDYHTVAKTLAEMAATTKRTVKLAVLKDLFVAVIHSAGGIHRDATAPESLLLTFVIDLVMGKLSVLTKKSSSSASPPPPLQVSGSAVLTAVLTVTGATRKQLSAAYRRTGDLGDCAAEFFADRQQNSVSRFFVVVKKRKKEEGSLSVNFVHEMLEAIATVPPGTGSQATRQHLIVKLLRACKDKDEIRFVVRTLLNNMRLGATMKTLIVALASAAEEIQQQTKNVASSSTTKSSVGAKTLEATFNICPRIPEIAHALLQGGVSFAAEHCSLTVGFPIQPMLANPASTFENVQEFLRDDRSGESLPAVLEWKYDGVRCQAHWDGRSVKLFSRNLLDITEQFPDVVEYLLEAKSNSVESFVIDSEVVGVESEDGSIRLLPFQDLSTRRGTKQQSQDNIRVCVFCFDVMYLNGTSLIKQSLWKRQEIVLANFAETANFRHASSVPLPHYDETTVRSALEGAVQGGAEGLMIKLTGAATTAALESSVKSGSSGSTSSRTFGYESGMRGKLWLKLKRDYVQGYADTIDVVPVGAWFGSGRKAQKDFLSPVLLAVYNDEDGTFQSVSRCMSFSDAMYDAMRDFYFNNTPYPPGVGIVDDDAERADGNGESTSARGASDDDEKAPEESEANSKDALTDDTVAVLDRINCLPSRPPSVVTNENPTIWFQPLEVFEVSFADLSLSKAHTAAADFVQDGRGIALRFPRFKRRRPDKSVEQATTAAQIAELFRQQSKVR